MIVRLHCRGLGRRRVIAVGLNLVATVVTASDRDWGLGFAEDEAPVTDTAPWGARGIIPDLATELFSRLPDERMVIRAGPWIRMQRGVASG
jgi:hypothetical protein